MIERHGAERILFATDNPWSDANGDIEIIKSYGLGAKIEDMIFSANARRLLGI